MLMKRAVGVIIKNARGEILLLQRSHQENSDQGKWTIAGGTVADEESYEQAAVRQVREELRLQIQPQMLKLVTENHFSYDDNDDHHHVRIYALIPPVNALPGLGEPHLTKAYRFVPIQELQRYELASYTEDDFKYLGWT